MHWNMACLASAMLPLVELNHSSVEAQELLKSALESFPIIFAEEWQKGFRDKLGLQTAEEMDIRLIERLLQLMHDSGVDYTSLFRSLGDIDKDAAVVNISLRDHFIDRGAIDLWLQDYLARLSRESVDDETRQALMNTVNPKYVLRNHLAQRAIELAQQDDFSEVHKLLKILSNPFGEQPEHHQYSQAPADHVRAIPVSCSS
jgi:uncharacterized protein YdiU (UPF0061 family)